MRKRLTTILRWTLFSLLLLLGIVGLVLPVVPQVPFFIAAFIVIAPESPWVRRRYLALRARYPSPLGPIERWRRRRREGRRDAIRAAAGDAAPPPPADAPGAVRPGCPGDRGAA